MIVQCPDCSEWCPGVTANCPACGRPLGTLAVPITSPEAALRAASAAPPVDVWGPGVVVLGDYKIERVLGEGGMGKVFLARSQSSGQRFAVKTALNLDDEHRRLFLHELQTWIDLPEHPHLAACRFFRSVGDSVAIFAEYVDGGSLDHWIKGGKLTTLSAILDVAIQFAWGLHAAHVHGVIHQDVKPADVLMTTEGVAKIADFGLARVRTADGAQSTRASISGAFVTAGGMTWAFCSPEQAAGQRLSRRTDQWSWGLSTLAMFNGRVDWRLGNSASLVLDRIARYGSAEPGFPNIPVEIEELLHRCFQGDPMDRWSSMAEVAERLIEIYRQHVGIKYPRSTPLLPRPERTSLIHDCGILG